MSNAKTHELLTMGNSNANHSRSKWLMGNDRKIEKNSKLEGGNNQKYDQPGLKEDHNNEGGNNQKNDQHGHNEDHSNKGGTPVLQWTSKAALKRLQNYSLLSLWLMVVDKKRDTVTFEDPLSGYKYFIKGLPYQIDDGAICYSGYGWLLFYGEHGLKFNNPFINAVHYLPNMAGFHFYWLCFSVPPTSPDCMVVGFSEEGCSQTSKK
nr:hypothetical protein [Tanacetum cinerariifolium]